MSGQGLDRAQGWGTDVMFHSFDVVMNDAFVQAEELEKIGQEFMPVGDVAGQFLSGSGEDKSAVFFVFKQAVGTEPLDHVGHAGLRDLQGGRDIDHASVTLGVDQFEDALEIILHRGGAARGGARTFTRHDARLEAPITDSQRNNYLVIDKLLYAEQLS